MKPPQLESLVGYWDFGKKSNLATVQDLSGKGNNGTLANFAGTGAEYLIDTRYGQVLHLNGPSAEYINCGSDPSLDNLETYTQLALVRFNSFYSLYDLIICKDTYWSRGLQVRCVGGSGYIKFSDYYPAPGTSVASTSIETLNIDQWQCVVMTYSVLTDRKAHIYIDGKVVTYSSQVASIGDKEDDSGRTQQIGSADAAKGMNGQVKIAAVWNSVLSPAEINRYSHYLLKEIAPKRPMLANIVTGKNYEQGLTNHWQIKNNAITVTDLVGTDDGTWAGTPDLNAGQFNKNHIEDTRGFDGINDRITCVGTRALSGYSLGTKARFNSGARLAALTMGDTGDSDIIGVGVEGGGLAGHDNHIVYAHYDSVGATGWHVADSGITPDPDKYYTLFGVNDGTDLRLYINGILAAENLGGGSVMGSGSYTAYIGSRHSAADTNWMDGQITETWVFDSILSEDEIRELTGQKEITLDFQDGLAGWATPGTSKPFFINESGNLEFSNMGAIYRGITYPFSFTSGEIEFSAKNATDNDAFLEIVFMMNRGGNIETSTYNGYQLALIRDYAGASVHQLQHTNGLGPNIIDTDATEIDANFNIWKIRKVGSSFKVYFNDVLLYSTTDVTWSTSDSFGIRGYNNGGWDLKYVKIIPM